MDAVKLGIDSVFYGFLSKFPANNFAQGAFLESLQRRHVFMGNDPLSVGRTKTAFELAEDCYGP